MRFQPALKKYFSAGGRVFPVGRLDADSEGLVLLTDDGKCADALLQPKSKVAKTYVVEFERDVDDGDVTRLADGVEIETPQQRSGATTTQKRGRARCPARASGDCGLFYRRAATASCGAWPRPWATPSCGSSAWPSARWPSTGSSGAPRGSDGVGAGRASSRTSTRRLLLRRQRGRGDGVGR